MTPDHQTGKADILIVGGGTAGCVLANRLSADPDRKVVMVEAGGDGTDPRIRDPRRWPTLLGSEFDWRYETEPQAALLERRLPYPRGRVLGGSSAINAMSYQRGHASGFDAWASWGNPGWDFDGLLPYFKRCEDFSGGADHFRGVGGPIHVVRPEGERRNPVAAAYIEAVREAGYGFTEDFNGAHMAGAAWNQMAIRDGVRQSTASAYLDPVRHRPNLTVLTGTTVLRLVFEGTRCRGARVSDPEGTRVLVADETMLTCGAIDSPRLLMLSGIGPADDLAAWGIEPRLDLPGVGRNLHDHLLAGIVYRPKRPIPLSHFNHGEGMFFADSGMGRHVPDLVLMCVTTKKFQTPKTGPVPEDGYSIVPSLMVPESRGRVTLAGADPRVPARIDPNYFGEPRDRTTFVRGVEMARALGRSGAMRDWCAEEVLPGDDVSSRTALDAYVRNAVTSFFHPAGTCRMGSDATAVVGPDLLLRGAAGLRVVDASVIPQLPNALPYAAVVAVAEKASALVAGTAVSRPTVPAGAR